MLTTENQPSCVRSKNIRHLQPRRLSTKMQLRLCARRWRCLYSLHEILPVSSDVPYIVSPKPNEFETWFLFCTSTFDETGITEPQVTGQNSKIKWKPWMATIIDCCFVEYPYLGCTRPNMKNTYTRVTLMPYTLFTKSVRVIWLVRHLALWLSWKQAFIKMKKPSRPSTRHWLQAKFHLKTKKNAAGRTGERESEHLKCKCPVNMLE